MHNVSRYELDLEFMTAYSRESQEETLSLTRLR